MTSHSPWLPRIVSWHARLSLARKLTFLGVLPRVILPEAADRNAEPLRQLHRIALGNPDASYTAAVGAGGAVDLFLDLLRHAHQLALLKISALQVKTQSKSSGKSMKK